MFSAALGQELGLSVSEDQLWSQGWFLADWVMEGVGD